MQGIIFIMYYLYYSKVKKVGDFPIKQVSLPPDGVNIRARMPLVQLARRAVSGTSARQGTSEVYPRLLANSGTCRHLLANYPLLLRWPR